MAAGNFGSALVRILGRNALRHDVFDNEVRMYVHEEMIDGKPLTKIINETNEMLGLLTSIDRHGLDVIAMTIATNRDMVKRFAIPVMNLEGWPIARWTWIESQFVNIQMQAQ